MSVAVAFSIIVILAVVSFVSAYMADLLADSPRLKSKLPLIASLLISMGSVVALWIVAANYL